MNAATASRRPAFDSARAETDFQEHRQAIFRRTDGMLLWLLAGQWFAGVGIASWISPEAWAGTESYLHPHVWAAVFLGGIITSLPIALAALCPGRVLTRHTVAAGQMLMSALLIHLCGGRIETHFHIFGSLAFLSFYRDWRVIVTASVVVAADHLARGFWWPASIYGELTTSLWRAAEHIGWVVFEDVFLLIAIQQSLHAMREIAERHATLEFINARIESNVTERTAELTAEIAERRAAEQSLKVSDQRFRELAETIEEVFWIAAPDCHRLLYLSPAFEAIWGRTCASLYERPETWLEVVVPEDQAVVVAGRNTGARGQPYQIEYRIVRPDGMIRWIHSRGFPVCDEAGKLERVVGLSADITERKRIEVKLLEAGKLETVGRLAGGIAHDFNTIMTIIAGHAELIAEGAEPGSQARQSAAQIGVSASRAAELTHQLLAFGRKQILQPEILDLNAIVDGSEKMLQGLLGPRITLSVRCRALHPGAQADAVQIQQMLVQLALNGRDAMPDGGKLIIRTGNIALGETQAAIPEDIPPGEYVLIAVTDSGAGLSDELKLRVFEPFFTTKPQGAGAGLGLSMCFGIAKQHGGHISVSSEPNQGASFKIYLPCVTELSVPRPGAAPEALSHFRGHETILLVESDPVLRDCSAVLLEKLGYDVHQAANAADAIRTAISLPKMDLLLADVTTPQMSGADLAAQLRASRAPFEVLFTTLQRADATQHRSGCSPALDLLYKPYAPVLLSSKVREVLDKRGL
jgi:PAS domain S-box-containing protein